MFFFYQVIVLVIILFSPVILIFRIIKNKEHKIRFKEKFSFFSKKRGNGNLIWFHGSSVGELLSVIPLIEELEKNNSINKILITSSTLSSAFIFKRFKFKKTIHQFFPLDFIFFSKRFIDYWKPNIAIFIESEIWPSMFLQLNKKTIPLLLLNARITKKTFQKWGMINKFSKKIFKSINIAYPQNEETLRFLQKMNVSKIKYIGNLKYSENKQDQITSLSRSFKKQLKNRKIWCASSTHHDEEIKCAKAHINLKVKYPNLLTIIIPRHINRVNEIKNQIESLGLAVISRNSKNKIFKNTDIYLVDTYGETKKFYKISNTVFLGGSLINRGGQNPIEAASLGSSIIHGPNIKNFEEVYKLFDKNKISHKVNNLNELIRSVEILALKPKNKKNKYLEIKKIGNRILIQTKDEINKILKNENKKT